VIVYCSCIPEYTTGEMSYLVGVTIDREHPLPPGLRPSDSVPDFSSARSSIAEDTISDLSSEARSRHSSDGEGMLLFESFGNTMPEICAKVRFAIPHHVESITGRLSSQFVAEHTPRSFSDWLLASDSKEFTTWLKKQVSNPRATPCVCDFGGVAILPLVLADAPTCPAFTPWVQVVFPDLRDTETADYMVDVLLYPRHCAHETRHDDRLMRARRRRGSAYHRRPASGTRSESSSHTLQGPLELVAVSRALVDMLASDEPCNLSNRPNSTGGLSTARCLASL